MRKAYCVNKKSSSSHEYLVVVAETEELARAFIRNELTRMFNDLSKDHSESKLALWGYDVELLKADSLPENRVTFCYYYDVFFNEGRYYVINEVDYIASDESTL